MIPRTWLLLVLLALPLSAPGAGPRLLVIPETTTLELGEPLRLTLHAEASEGNLFGLSLASLEPDFRVRWTQRSRGVRGPDRVWQRQEMRLELYARRPGTFELPPLRLMDAVSEPLTVHVDPPHSLGLALHATTDNAQPYVREPVVLRLDVETDHNQFELHIPGPMSREAHIEFLRRERHEESQDGRYRLRHYWLIIPLYEGPLELELPWLEMHDFRRQGVPLRLPAETVHLDVRAVPGYLPVDVALAPVAVRQSISPGSHAKGEPALWTLELQGRDLSLRRVRRLVERVTDGTDGALRFHAPAIERLTPRDVPPGEAVLRVEIPFTPRSTGDLRVPDLRIPWFDTTSGRLTAAEAPGGLVQVYDPLRRVLLQATAAFVALLAAGLLVIALGAVIRRFRVRRILHRRVAEAGSARALARALLTLEASPPTLRGWLDAQGADARLTDAVTHLERACYGSQPGDVAALRAELRTALTRHRLRFPARRRAS
ncbi:hypothetical protein B1C78_11505 [Thioalkalivibrio denitrificans]|uniref:Protein BatD n=1 Tax=Thioalkalivibrio denitrificans TaxID=108003 RepID=A0A1V3NE53_9GAMM|nr:BatD family protein [Thioalkalivibrio denitrificans]OOG23367.1 hypothetical protein B1C78_11505 [Thioalkalivibrio denitrificans]